MAQAPRDQNQVPVLLAIDDVTGLPRPLLTDAAGNLLIVAAGGGGFSTCVRAYRNTSTQSIPATTNTVIVFNAENFDAASEFSTSTGLFTAANTGHYQVSMNISIISPTVNTSYIIKIQKNGVDWSKTVVVASGGGSNAAVAFTDIVSLSATDTVGVVAYFLNAKSVQNGIDESFVSISRVT